jgi:hypothetical protein
MTVNNGGGILTFAYETKTVFNISRLITAYRMRDMSDDKGNLTGDALMLTEDERAVFDLTVNNAAQFVCDELKKLTQGKGQMFIIEEDRLIFNIVNRRKYNVNALAGIDVAIFNVLYNSCIYQFYEIINQEKQAELFRAKFIEAQAMLHDRCYEIRKQR